MKAKRDFQVLWAIPVLIVVCLCGLPAQAKYGGGSGTASNPYQIATAADLILLGDSSGDYGKHFMLTADIDLDPNLPGRKVFHNAVISSSLTSFNGSFDGNGHTISHLTIKGGGYLGLFGGFGSGAEVKDLGVVDVNIMGSGDPVGALVGSNGWWVAGAGTVTRCYSTGAVRGGGRVGGLVGFSYGTVTQCYSTAAVTGTGGSVGGLVGWNNRTVTLCYSTGAVTGTGWSSVGGLVGYNWEGTVTQCYSAGAVSGPGDMGGLVGYNSGMVLHCVWDVQASGRSGSSGGVGLTTAEMMDPDVLGLSGFGGDPNWVLDAGRDYPMLAWEGSPGKMIPEPSTEWLEGRGTAEDPYRLDMPGQLTALSEAPFLWDKHFILTADIDLAPNLPGRKIFDKAVIAPNSSSPFIGVFDGKGHTISHLTIRGQSYLGLFGRLEAGAIVKDLGVVDVNVTGSGGNVGGLVGGNGGAVTQCYSTGVVTGEYTVGGLVGSNGGTVTQCYSTAAVTGAVWIVGGLVGINGEYYSRPSTVTQCYSTGEVSGKEYVGGLVGLNENATVTQCYSTGEVSGGSYVGGLVARNGQNGEEWWRGTVTVSFWDTQTSRQDTSNGGRPGGGTGKTTAEMQAASTFVNAGWDFRGETANGTEGIWWIDEGQDYPRFRWEHQARPYCPSHGAMDVVQRPVLHWRPGARGLQHDVYFGDSEVMVASATPSSLGVYRGRQMAEATTYDPGMLECSRTYYWRIDEVNEADPDSPWKGEVWSFTTADVIVLSVVDDFESYADNRGHFIFKTWIDRGGSSVGNFFPPENPPYAEQRIVHGGKQSMPMEYCNDAEPWYYDGDLWYSEAQRTWETPQDWAISGADALTLYFRGQADNGLDPLYVRVEDSVGHSVMVTHPDPNAVLATEWQKWHIPLADLQAAGVDPAAVKTMVIGVGDRSNPKPGGTGKIYIDDIRLTKRMP